VQNRIATATVTALLVAGVAACSSDQANHPSQATVTINGNTVATKQRVVCAQQLDALPGKPQQMYWAITIGDQQVSGAKAMLNDSGQTLVANSVHIQNLGGFTGMYSKDDGGEANASFASETFTISGTAEGFSTYQPNEPAKATFKIVATC
jgi:Mycobacterium 19 kDa lipoprotein antigen